MTGEISEQRDYWWHDLNSLLCLMQANLAKLDEIPEWSPKETTRELIEDMAKFGVFGEALRYPITTIKMKTLKKAGVDRWPDGLIPDVEAVIASAENAWRDFGGLISYLMEYERYVRDLRSEYEQYICSEYE